MGFLEARWGLSVFYSTAYELEMRSLGVSILLLLLQDVDPPHPSFWMTRN